MLKKIFCLFFLLLPLYAQDKTVVSSIELLSGREKIFNASAQDMLKLIDLKEGDIFNRNKVRLSMDKLYSTGLFEYIEVKAQQEGNNRVKLIFIFNVRKKIDKIRVLLSRNKPMNKAKKNIFSLKEKGFFDSIKLEKAKDELRSYLNSIGYINFEMFCDIYETGEESVSLDFYVGGESYQNIGSFNLFFPDYLPLKKERYSLKGQYEDAKVNSLIEKLKNKLRKNGYFFPNISIHKSIIKKNNLSIDVKITPGYKYIFEFEGSKNLMRLISSAWENKVFEKWAQDESRARILKYYRDKGYLDIKVNTKIVISKNKREKVIKFETDKGHKYKLGKTVIKGNESFKISRLRSVIETGRRLFDKFFWIKPNLVQADIIFLKNFYYFKGYPDATVNLKYIKEGKCSNVVFDIREGKKYSIDSILITGNKKLKKETLLRLLKSKENRPFVQSDFRLDLVTLKEKYLSLGFLDYKEEVNISGGAKKSILIKIEEGTQYKFKDLIITGASSLQKIKVIRDFPLKKDNHYNQLSIKKFKNKLERFGIFSMIKMEEMRFNNEVVVYLHLRPDEGKFYGVGLGYEERRGLRTTLEYQKRNIFKSYSNFSATLQAGLKEVRGIFSLTQNNFLGLDIKSTYRLWKEHEIYSIYTFDRAGAGLILLKNFNKYSYSFLSFSLYATKLKELKIEAYSINRLFAPYNTFALNCGYIKDNRDDPFNPTKGQIVSYNVKWGLPIYGFDERFLKFMFSYQINFPFFKYNVFSLSLRNGYIWGTSSITERFFAGGGRTFRGRKNDRLGPISSLSNMPVGGKALLLLNAELTIPIPLILNRELQFAFFTDFGNVFNEIRQQALSDLESCVGFSLKYKTPLGPIRIDLAWHLQEKRDSFVVQIGIGNVF